MRILQKMHRQDMQRNAITYHLRWKQVGFQRFSRCNSQSSQAWVQYSIDNFRRGKIYYIETKKEMKIPGKRCRKCFTLMTKNSHKA